tara:strand:+ start:1598 stop:1780 length:183 start_codon:yes stop_codon:yes gene_type:complete
LFNNYNRELELKRIEKHLRNNLELSREILEKKEFDPKIWVIKNKITIISSKRKIISFIMK